MASRGPLSTRATADTVSAEMEDRAYEYSRYDRRYDGDGIRTKSTASRSHCSVSTPHSVERYGRKRMHASPSRASEHRPNDDDWRDPPPLTWRLDPDESLSDWTLTVASADSVSIEARKHDRGGTKIHTSALSDESDALDEEGSGLPENPLLATLATVATVPPPAKKYFVHRAQLAVGPRRSEYFATLFKNRRRTLRRTDSVSDGSANGHGTHIELKASAAAAFPAMLDFIYSPVGTPVDASTDSAVALRHLASCFGIREMFNEVTDFIKRDLRPDTAPTYLQEAATYRHEKLQAASTKVCAESFESIKLSRIVLLPPHLFEQVVRSPHLLCDSEILSTRVASYCRCRPGGVSLEALHSLTDAEVMPCVAPDESLFYIHLLSVLGVELPDRSSAGSAPTLYERCVAASPNVVRGALELSKSAHSPKSSRRSERRHRRKSHKDYDDLPSGVKVDLLESTIADGRPSSEISGMPDSRSSSVALHASEGLAGDLAESRQQVVNLEDEIRRTRKKYEKQIASYESRLIKSEEEMQRCKAELSRFVRVPNEYSVTPLLSEYTYKGRPAYNEYGESMYGHIPPTAMPGIQQGDSLDGWIYREEMWDEDGETDTRYWPMYYYKGDN